MQNGQWREWGQKCPKNCPHALWMTPYDNDIININKTFFVQQSSKHDQVYVKTELGSDKIIVKFAKYLHSSFPSWAHNFLKHLIFLLNLHQLSCTFLMISTVSQHCWVLKIAQKNKIQKFYSITLTYCLQNWKFSVWKGSPKI